MIYQQCSNVAVQMVEDEALILDLNKDQIHQLNTTAAFVWNKCDGRTPIDKVTARLTEEFDIDSDTAKNDIEQILKQLCELELIEPAEIKI
jgi:hypothetical protein